MTYVESEHPRDEKGRWTTKFSEGDDGTVLTGSISKTAGSLFDKLFGKLGKGGDGESSEYRAILLNTLGQLATPAVIFYATTKQLEKMIIDNGLTENLSKNIIKKSNVDFGFDKSSINLWHYKKLSDDYDKELAEFLHKNTLNPDYYGNDLRHQYVSAIFARNLGKNVTKIMGNLEEIKGHASAPGDSKIDQINNEIGRNYGLKYPNMPRQELMQLLLKDHQKNVEIRNKILKERK